MQSISDPYASLKIKEFSFYLIARFFFIVAIQIQGVAVAWQIFDYTDDPLSLGLIGLAEAIPSIGVSLFAGYIADIFDRKTIISICMLGMIFCVLILIGATGYIQFENKEHQIYTLYLAIFLSGLARGFIGPAVFAFMPQLLPDKSFYTNAVSWNSSTWQLAAVLGPALGGILFAYFGALNTYYIVFSIFLISISMVTLIKKKPLQVHTVTLKIAESIKVGIHFIFSNPLILSAISLDLFAVLFGGAIALLPAFAKDILEVGPVGLGWLKAAPAVGAVLMAMLVAYLPLNHNAGKKLLWSVAGFGICMIAFALSQNYYLSLFVLFLSGMFDSVSVIVRSSLLHLNTPENMKGRVSAVNNIFIGSSNEIGAFESGVTAKWMGIVPSVLFGGVMTLIVVGTTAKFAKKLRNLNLNQSIDS